MSVIGLAPDYLTLALLLIAVGVSTPEAPCACPAMIKVSGKSRRHGHERLYGDGRAGAYARPDDRRSGRNLGVDGLWRMAAVGWLASAIFYWRLRTATARRWTRRRWG